VAAPEPPAQRPGSGFGAAPGRRGETLPSTAGPAGFAPTGVPGGLGGGNAFGGGRGRFTPGGPPLRTSAPPAEVLGLIGPVRVLAQ
jgi:hypothetical protein